MRFCHVFFIQMLHCLFMVNFKIHDLETFWGHLRNVQHMDAGTRGAEGAAASRKQGLTYSEFTRRPKLLRICQKQHFTKFIVWLTSRIPARIWITNRNLGLDKYWQCAFKFFTDSIVWNIFLKKWWTHCMCWGYTVLFNAGVGDLHCSVLKATQWQLLISRQTFMGSSVYQYRLSATPYMNCVGLKSSLD